MINYYISVRGQCNTCSNHNRFFIINKYSGSIKFYEYFPKISPNSGKVIFQEQKRKLIRSKLIAGTCNINIPCILGNKSMFQFYVYFFFEFNFACAKFSTFFQFSLLLTGLHINHAIRLYFPIVYHPYHTLSDLEYILLHRARTILAKKYISIWNKKY